MALNLRARKPRKQQPTEETFLPRGAPERYRSRSVLKMPGGGPLVETVEEEEGVVSEAQRQLQELLKKQLDTSAGTEKGTLERRKQFTPATTFKPLGQEVEGLRSLEQYQAREEDHSRIDQLRQMGLTPQEIELKLLEEGHIELPVKRTKFGADPKAQEDRMKAINEKIEERQKGLREPIRYAGVKHMSRHAMEVERSLFRGSTEGNPLQHLTVQGSRKDHFAYPAQIMPVGGSSEKIAPIPSRMSTDERHSAEESDAHTVPPLPVPVIERNRLTMAEILTKPRFRDYTPGEPSKVLYLKNLHPKVSTDDLQTIFGHFSTPSGWPKIRVMTGKMRGQAFVEFESVETATKAFQLVNGYLVRDKPVIVSYGKGQAGKK